MADLSPSSIVLYKILLMCYGKNTPKNTRWHKPAIEIVSNHVYSQHAMFGVPFCKVGGTIKAVQGVCWALLVTLVFREK